MTSPSKSENRHINIILRKASVFVCLCIPSQSNEDLFYYPFLQPTDLLVTCKKDSNSKIHRRKILFGTDWCACNLQVPRHKAFCYGRNIAPQILAGSKNTFAMAWHRYEWVVCEIMQHQISSKSILLKFLRWLPSNCRKNEVTNALIWGCLIDNILKWHYQTNLQNWSFVVAFVVGIHVADWISLWNLLWSHRVSSIWL